MAHPDLLHRRPGRHHVARSLEPARPQAEPVRHGVRQDRHSGGGGIINFVVITAAASSCNSGIFSTGRMLYTLAQFGQAPRFLGKVNAGHVPAAGATVSTAVMLIGVLLNYVVPERVFVWVISVATVGALWTWAMILIAHLGYRKAVAEGRAEASPFRMPGSPVTNWISLAFIVLVTCFLALDPNTRVALYVGPVWFAILALGYRLTKSPEP